MIAQQLAHTKALVGPNPHTQGAHAPPPHTPAPQTAATQKATPMMQAPPVTPEPAAVQFPPGNGSAIPPQPANITGLTPATRAKLFTSIRTVRDCPACPCHAPACPHARSAAQPT